MTHHGAPKFSRGGASAYHRRWRMRSTLPDPLRGWLPVWAVALAIVVLAGCKPKELEHPRDEKTLLARSAISADADRLIDALVNNKVRELHAWMTPTLQGQLRLDDLSATNQRLRIRVSGADAGANRSLEDHMFRRMRPRPLVRAAGVVATTAVVAGTAGAVSHHQQQKYAQQNAAAQQQQEMGETVPC